MVTVLSPNSGEKHSGQVAHSGRIRAQLFPTFARWPFARGRGTHHAVCSASASKNMTMLDALVYLILGLVGDGMEQQKVHYV
jgi:hypothetical protein